MTYKEFLAKIEEAGIISKDWSGDYPELITEDWTTGGRTGGSCWGCSDKDYRPRDIEPEKNIDELDKIIELIYPSITFLQYKAMIGELITVSHEKSTDWYGNDEEYSRKRLSLEELYDYLVDREWIDGH